MTQDETLYYNNLKNNASLNPYVFDKLFSIINGHTVDKPNVALQLLGGVPMVVNTFNDNNIFAGLFPQVLDAPSFNENSLGDITSNKSFEDRSNEYANNKPFGQNSLFAKKALQVSQATFNYDALKWKYQIYQSDSGTELINEYKKEDTILANSAGGNDDDIDFIIYIENDFTLNLGKVLLIKMSIAMLQHYFKEPKESETREETVLNWSKSIHEQQKSKIGFSATVQDIVDAFNIEIVYRVNKNNGLIQLTPSEIASIVTTQFSKKIRRIKIDRENWDPTLKSDKYKLQTFDNGVNYVISVLNFIKKEITNYKKDLQLANTITNNSIIGKISLVEDAIQFLTNLENGITATIELIKNSKKTTQEDFAFLCGIINGLLEFICGIIDVIVLVLELIITASIKDNTEIQLDYLQLREGLEEFIEAFIKEPDFIKKQVALMLQAYEYARYKAPKLTKYQIAHNTGEDLVLAIDLILSFIAIIKALTNSSKYLPKFTEWIDDIVERNPRVANKIENTILKLVKVVYGESELSKIAIKFRKTLGKAKLHNGNIAILEYLDDTGKIKYKEFTTLTEPEWKTLGYRKKPHAEQIMIDWAIENNVSKEKVTKIYSELEPCNFEKHFCKRQLETLFPNAQKEFSYDYPGKLGDDLKSIRDNSIKERASDMQKLVK